MINNINYTNLLKIIIASVLIAKIIIIFIVLPIFSDSLREFYGNSHFPDDYDKLAINIAKGIGYRLSPDTAETVLREPGFPLVLTLLFSVFGYSIVPVQILNIICGIVTSILVFKLSHKLFQNVSLSYLSVLLYMANPGTIIVESRGGPEALFTLLVVSSGYLLINAFNRKKVTYWLASGYLLINAFNRKKVTYWLASGCLIGVSCLIKGIFIFFPFVIILYLFFKKYDSYPVPIRLGHFLVLLLSIVVILSPWVTRNYQLTDKFIPTSSVVGISAFTGQFICKNIGLDTNFKTLDKLSGKQREKLAIDNNIRFRRGYYPQYFNTKDEVLFSGKLLGLVLETYKKRPELALKCMAGNVFYFWFAGKTWGATLANFIVQSPYVILALIGILISLYRSNDKSTILALMIIYYYLVHIPILSQARYSITLMPFISIFAVMGLSYLSQRFVVVK